MTIGEKYIPTQDKVVWYSDDGTMLYGWMLYGWQNKTVYYNKDGWIYGHQLINGKKYYFNTITGAKE